MVTMALTPDVSTNAGPLAELYEAGRYFTGQGSVHYVLEQLVEDFERHGIDYVVIGAVALFAHGYRRFTNNIDVVLTVEGFERFVKAPQALGNYDQDVTSYRRVHSVPHGVSIRVKRSGEYPGDGKPKPVSMPAPLTDANEIGGIKFVTFEKLLELKLASGMTAPHRLKDLADVQELIKVRALQPEFAERLDPYVREKFVELAEAVKQSPQDSK